MSQECCEFGHQAQLLSVFRQKSLFHRHADGRCVEIAPTRRWHASPPAQLPCDSRASAGTVLASTGLASHGTVRRMTTTRRGALLGTLAMPFLAGLPRHAAAQRAA